MNPIRLKWFVFALAALLFTNVLFESRFSATTSRATWAIQEDDSFTYIIDSSGWLIQMNGYSQDGYGATFQTLNFNDKSSFTLQVLSVDEIWGVEFRINNSTNSETGIISEDRFHFELVNTIYYSIFESQRLLNDGFNEQTIKRGPKILDWFFIQPEQRTWEYLNNISTIEYHNNLPRTDVELSGTFMADFTRNNAEATLDLLLEGSFENKTNKTSVQFEHTMKFVWNGTTGVLLGYRFSAQFQGTYQGHLLSEQIAVILRLKDYVLPRFKFFTGFLPGVSFSLAAMAIVVITFTWLFRKKRRKGKI